MKLMSFALTTPQFRARTKDVTRRNGWRDLKRGDVVEGVEKGQGLKKGEHPVRLGRIRIKSNRLEALHRMTRQPEYGRAEVIREGFPDMTPEGFVAMYCKHNKCKPNALIRRIEFEYL